jgi:3D (Asp-Asp-Asp) domain-containing protein
MKSCSSNETLQKTKVLLGLWAIISGAALFMGAGYNIIPEQEAENVFREQSRQAAEELPYSTEIRYVPDLAADEQRIVQKGQPGELLNTYIDTYEDQQIVASRLQEKQMVQRPRKEIIEKGNVNYFITPEGTKVRYEEKFTMEATAYTAGYESTGKRPGHPAYGVTRSGTRVRPGVVAVDPDVIPLGTRVYVESLDGTRSYGYASAEDTGGDIKEKRIDLYYEQVTAARNFGRRDVRVYILHQDAEKY